MLAELCEKSTYGRQLKMLTWLQGVPLQRRMCFCYVACLSLHHTKESRDTYNTPACSLLPPKAGRPVQGWEEGHVPEPPPTSAGMRIAVLVKTQILIQLSL